MREYRPNYIDQLPFGAGTVRQGTGAGYYVWASTERETGRYLASNAFGVTVSVRRSEETGTGVKVCPGDSRGQCVNLAAEPFRFPASSDEARSLDRNARALLIGTLAPPYVDWGGYRAFPELHRPRDHRKSVDLVVMRPEQLWIVPPAVSGTPG